MLSTLKNSIVFWIMQVHAPCTCRRNTLKLEKNLLCTLCTQTTLFFKKMKRIWILIGFIGFVTQFPRQLLLNCLTGSSLQWSKFFSVRLSCWCYQFGFDTRQTDEIYCSGKFENIISQGILHEPHVTSPDKVCHTDKAPVSFYWFCM